MGKNEQNNGADKQITQENIRQVRESAENRYRNEEASAEQNAEDQFYNDVNQQSERIEELVAQIEEFPNPAIRSLLAECVETILTLHGTGLERIFQLIEETDGSTEDLKKALLDDDFIEGLLVIHNMHPDDLETRLYRALDKVKPYMDSHGGSVEVLSLEDGVATLKLEGSCDGCPSSATTLELGIKQAIEEECPDLVGLEVEGLADNPLAREIRNQNMAGDAGSGSQNNKQGWTTITGLGNLSNGEKQSVRVDDVPLIVCMVNDQLYAYRNECAGCGMTFDNGKIENKKLKCKLGHKFDVQKAGVCPDDPDIHLHPFPLLKENGQVKVAVE